MTVSPIKLTPACKAYLWGGEKLRTYGLETADTPLAEAWVLSAHPDGDSVVSGGADDGCTLREYLQRHPEAAGKNCEKFADFPVLIKLIDAKKDLSVQVHPDDRYAARYGQNGKTEMWHILSAEPGASLYCGFSRPVTAGEVRRRATDGTLTELLNRVPVKAGDTFFIPPGTVHAIGAGMVLCEVQQNSNLTYRLYDYGRLGADGQPRPLHLDEAIRVAHLIPPRADTDTPAGYLAVCRYFAVRAVTLADTLTEMVTDDSFVSLVVTEGDGTLQLGEETIPFHKGDSLFLPAQEATYTLCGTAKLLVTTVLQDG